jgi:Glucosamine 6-phosphate synthetase, contains amidotransferase and phosphosugar isomerase domains
MWKEILEQPEVLKNCRKTNAELIKKVAEEIKSRDIRSVVIAARGTSDNAAIYGKYLFETLLGIPVVLAAPSVVTVYGGSLRLQNSLVIGISQSGKAGDAAEIIRAGNSCGAVTVTITNYVDSPLAGLSTYHLFCAAGDEKSVAATKTFTAQMYLLAMLATELAGKRELKEEFERVPENISKAFALADTVAETVQRYRFMKECFVLARGFNYPIALEAALKIQESSYIRAKAFATSDFYHGPMAMIEKDMPVIVFAPHGPSLADVTDMIKKLKESGADLLVVSDLDEICALGNCALRIPETESDCTSVFVNAAVAQMFACRLSLLKGLNPDEPRMLHKVTITR